MSREDRRQRMDPRFVEKLRSRLARIRTHQAAQQTEALVKQWEQLPPNWIEQRLLAAKRKETRNL